MVEPRFEFAFLKQVEKLSQKFKNSIFDPRQETSPDDFVPQVAAFPNFLFHHVKHSFETGHLKYFY